MKAVITFIFLLMPQVLFGQSTEKILAIRKEVELINLDKGYQTKTLTNDYFTDVKNEVMDNGQELTGYYKNGELKKMVYSVGPSYGMITDEYFFEGAKLIFVYEHEKVYPEQTDKSGNFTGLDYTKLVPDFEGRYYLDEGKIIATKTKGKPKFTDVAEHRFLGYLKNLLDDLKAK